MSNYGNISSEIPGNDLNSILQKLDEIRNLMPFLVNLTTADRTKGMRLGDKSIPFVEKSLEYANSTPVIFPSYMDVAEFSKDVLLFKALKQVLRALHQLVEAVDDTALAVGKEAFDQALAVYNNVQQASTRNVPGTDAMHTELKSRFKASRSGNGESEGRDTTADDTDGIQSPESPAA